jgi:hypothetical protein
MTTFTALASPRVWNLDRFTSLPPHKYYRKAYLFTHTIIQVRGQVGARRQARQRDWRQARERERHRRPGRRHERSPMRSPSGGIPAGVSAGDGAEGQGAVVVQLARGHDARERRRRRDRGERVAPAPARG